MIVLKTKRHSSFFYAKYFVLFVRLFANIFFFTFTTYRQSLTITREKLDSTFQ